jgi:uncharacterized protein YndB with AHSA1/START domain
MSIDVTAQATIEAERERVASYATDPRNDPLWIGGIVEAEMLSDPPLEKGSTVRRVATFLGKRIEYVMEVAELEPGSRIVMRSVRSPFPMVVTYSFADASGGTRARIRVEGEPAGLYRVAGPVMAQAVKRSILRDVRTLKAIMESGARDPGVGP